MQSVLMASGLVSEIYGYSFNTIVIAIYVAYARSRAGQMLANNAVSSYK